MTMRSAPFKPIGIEAVTSERGGGGSVLFSQLLLDIKQFRNDRLPPPYLEQVRDLPIFHGNKDSVTAYRNEWQPLINIAKNFYPSAYLPPENLPFPASLEVPQFIYHVEKISLNKTKAKESKSFGSVGAMLEKCGVFSRSDMDKLNEVSESASDDFRLVAHRSFIDLRAYVFCVDAFGEKIPPQRVRFYKTGLIIQTTENFTIIDQRQAPRKQRNDAYKDPIATNDTWKVFLKSG